MELVHEVTEGSLTYCYDADTWDHDFQGSGLRGLSVSFASREKKRVALPLPLGFILWVVGPLSLQSQRLCASILMSGPISTLFTGRSIHGDHSSPLHQTHGSHWEVYDNNCHYDTYCITRFVARQR
jgi:hypothetical protein